MTFFDWTADLVGQLNGNGQKGMLQTDAPPVYATEFVADVGCWLSIGASGCNQSSTTAASPASNMVSASTQHSGRRVHIDVY